MPIAGSAFSNGCISTSVRIATKYFPLEFRLTVALIIRPYTSQFLANGTKPSFGSLILLPTMAILPFICFAV
ncbi:hypothetical protein [Bacillus cereus]|uniref:hypothetical protein n=1 Tax=Bacillus cereus TaxID=1396 RepID=UPI003EDFE8F4